MQQSKTGTLASACSAHPKVAALPPGLQLPLLLAVLQAFATQLFRRPCQTCQLR